MRSKRFKKLAERSVNCEMFIKPWSEVGLITVGSPFDPSPSLRIKNGVVIEMDGVESKNFDLIDDFITRNALNLDIAERTSNTPSRDIAHMLAI
jgi:propanediol dehydratase large subunit